MRAFRIICRGIERVLGIEPEFLESLSEEISKLTISDNISISTKMEDMNYDKIRNIFELVFKTNSDEVVSILETNKANWGILEMQEII